MVLGEDEDIVVRIDPPTGRISRRVVPKPVPVSFSCEGMRLEYVESRGGMNTLAHYAVLENIYAEGGLVAERMRIPLDPEKYERLKEWYDHSGFEAPKFQISGDLEIAVRAICIN